LLVERLFDRTTDLSRMGKVRQCWREHLQLTFDDELFAVVRGWRVLDGHLSLDELRAQINIKARIGRGSSACYCFVRAAGPSHPP
jgi:hypothetical protein